MSLVVAISQLLPDELRQPARDPDAFHAFIGQLVTDGEQDRHTMLADLLVHETHHLDVLLLPPPAGLIA
jgi:hypothetical protein